MPSVFGALLLLCAQEAMAASEYVVPGGPLITVQGGRTIDGHVVGIDQTNVVIRTENGAEETLPRSTVESVAFETVTGQRLVGELVGWTSGVYQIATPDAAIKIYSTPPASLAAPAATDTPARTVAENRDERSLPIVPRMDDTAPEPAAAKTAEEMAAAETNGVVDAQDAALTPPSDLSIEVSVENSKENGAPVAFDIALSKSPETSVVLIYATIDGTAVEGEDYEANRGVLVIKPGERTARIEASVIDDDQSEGQETVKLFLTVDPTVASVESREIVATIDDDD